MTSTYIIEQNDGTGLGIDYTYLQWTTEAPTNPGLYKAVQVGSDQTVWVFLEKRFSGTGLTAILFDIEFDHGLDKFSKWFGPFPEPNKP